MACDEDTNCCAVVFNTHTRAHTPFTFQEIFPAWSHLPLMMHGTHSYPWREQVCKKGLCSVFLTSCMKSKSSVTRYIWVQWSSSLWYLALWSDQVKPFLKKFPLGLLPNKRGRKKLKFGQQKYVLHEPSCSCAVAFSKYSATIIIKLLSLCDFPL